jgi:hypothetical protein
MKRKIFYPVLITICLIINFSAHADCSRLTGEARSICIGLIEAFHPTHGYPCAVTEYAKTVCMGVTQAFKPTHSYPCALSGEALTVCLGVTAAMKSTHSHPCAVNGDAYAICVGIHNSKKEHCTGSGLQYNFCDAIKNAFPK